MARHNEILNKFKALQPVFDFTNKEHKEVVQKYTLTPLRNCFHLLLGCLTSSIFTFQIKLLSLFLLSLHIKTPKQEKSVVTLLIRLNRSGKIKQFSNLAQAKHSYSASDFHFQLMKIMVKVSDISNEARPMTVAEPWLDCLLQEFFNQVFPLSLLINTQEGSGNSCSLTLPSVTESGTSCRNFN